MKNTSSSNECIQVQVLSSYKSVCLYLRFGVEYVVLLPFKLIFGDHPKASTKNWKRNSAMKTTSFGFIIQSVIFCILLVYYKNQKKSKEIPFNMMTHVCGCAGSSPSVTLSPWISLKHFSQKWYLQKKKVDTLTFGTLSADQQNIWRLVLFTQFFWPHVFKNYNNRFPANV